MDTFEEDFLIEVEAHVEKRAPAHRIQKVWNPLGVAAPERHLVCAVPLGLPYEAICYQLIRNEAFQQLASILHLEFDRTTLRDCMEVVDDEENREKEQVWLFGYRWFSIYYEELLNVATLRSEFYRKHHSEFMDLLRRACEPSPAKRPTFQQLLEAWIRPVHIQNAHVNAQSLNHLAVGPPTPTPVQTEETAVSAVSLPAASDLPPAASAESPPVVAVPAKSAGGGRLVLNGQVRRVARNKTRRNPCN